MTAAATAAASAIFFLLGIMLLSSKIKVMSQGDPLKKWMFSICFA